MEDVVSVKRSVLRCPYVVDIYMIVEAHASPLLDNRPSHSLPQSLTIPYSILCVAPI